MFTEPNGWTELRYGVTHIAFAEWQPSYILARYRLLPVGWLEINRPQLEQLMGACVVRCDLIQPKGPTAMRYPVALLKVPGIQRAAPTTPAITATA